MAAKMGSFRYTLAEKKERLLSTKGYSDIGYANILEEEDEPKNCCSYRYFCDKIVGFVRKVQDVSSKAYQMGTSDPRKIVFSAKMGLALVLISLLIFFKQPVKELSQYSVWAILTVVVVFEFSIGKKNFQWVTVKYVHLCLYMHEARGIYAEMKFVLGLILVFFNGSSFNMCVCYAF